MGSSTARLRSARIAFGGVLLALGACRPGAPQLAHEPAAAAAPGAGRLSAAERAARIAAAQALLDAFHAAAARADEGAYFACFAPEAVFLGTDGSERWTLPEFRAYAAPHFAKGKAWTFRAEERFVTLDARGEIAWFDEALATEKLGPARGSGVLVWQGDAFAVAQYNLSVPIPNERFDEVRALLSRAPPEGGSPAPEPPAPGPRAPGPPPSGPAGVP